MQKLGVFLGYLIGDIIITLIEASIVYFAVNTCTFLFGINTAINFIQAIYCIMAKEACVTIIAFNAIRIKRVLKE